MAVSVLVHAAIFLFLYNTVVTRPPAGGAAPAAGSRVAPPGLQVIRIQLANGVTAPPAVPQVARPAPPRAAPAPRAPAPSAGAAAGKPGAAAGAGAAGAAGSAVDRLKPREGDRRLWVPVFLFPVQPTPQEKVETRIAGELQQWNDSVAAENADRERALDWTIHGKNGERWGIAPDGIHLGKITLPAPMFEGNAADRARVKEWETIQGQATRVLLNQEFKARVKAIRERKDAERKAAEAKKAAAKKAKKGDGHSSGGGGDGQR